MSAHRRLHPLQQQQHHHQQPPHYRMSLCVAHSLNGRIPIKGRATQFIGGHAKDPRPTHLGGWIVEWGCCVQSEIRGAGVGVVDRWLVAAAAAGANKSFAANVLIRNESQLTEAPAHKSLGISLSTSLRPTCFSCCCQSPPPTLFNHF